MLKDIGDKVENIPEIVLNCSDHNVGFYEKLGFERDGYFL